MEPGRGVACASLLAILGSLGIGCVHHLEIVNPPSRPFVGMAGDYPVSVGVEDRSSSSEVEPYVEAIARGLQTSRNVEQVVYPYAPGHDVDVVAYVDVTPEYRGAWTNFFVNWPGFLIFTPAWHGYTYHARLDTTIDIVAASTKQRLAGVEWSHEYEFKQSDIGRTWVEVGWLEYGIIPLVGAFFAMHYDTDQTEPFMKAVSRSYGDQIGQRVSLELTNPSVAALATRRLARRQSAPAVRLDRFGRPLAVEQAPADYPFKRTAPSFR